MMWPHALPRSMKARPAAIRTNRLLLSCERLEDRTLLSLSVLTPTSITFPFTAAEVGSEVWGLRQEVVVNGTLFFDASDSTHGEQLWESNGTATGTQMVTDINGKYSGCAPSNLTSLNGKLLFTAYSPSTDWSLWTYDATDGIQSLPGSPSMAEGANQQPVNDPVAPLTTMMINGVDYAYFDGEPASNNCPGCGIYRTDGTSVQLVAQNVTGSDITASNGMLFFDGGANETSFGYSGVWESNGLAYGTPGAFTQQITGFWGYTLTDVNGTLFFAGDNTVGGMGGGNLKLWTTNGTTVQQVTDMWPGHSDINGQAEEPEGPTINLNGTFYFEGADGIHATWGATGGELFKSDGTAAGTVLVKDIDPGSGGS